MGCCPKPGFSVLFWRPGRQNKTEKEFFRGIASHRCQLNGFMALGGAVPDLFFSSYFAASPRKKKKKGYFGGIASPKPPLCKAASRES
jgi:hypothetical protein